MRDFVLEFIRKIPSLVYPEGAQVQAALDSVRGVRKVCDLIEARAEDPHCPHCGATRIHKHGIRSRLQRYKCVSCRKTFNMLTGTPLARLRRKDLWLQNAECLLCSFVLRQIGSKLHIDKNTAFRWRHRFSSWLYEDTPPVLEGIIEADETYFRISQKGCRHIDRKPHKRGGDNSSPGLSKKQVCVLTACDRSQHSIEFITGLGPVKGKWLDLMLTNRIAPDAIMVTDGLKSYSHFCQKVHIQHVIVNNKLRNGGCYHIQHINACHSRIKGWINHHFRGVATKYLNHYLWWRHELENKHITSNIQLFQAVLC